MADILSRTEVESLLAALDVGPTTEPAPALCLDQEQISRLQAIHQTFSSEFAAKLSETLRSYVTVKLNGLDEVTFQNFLSGLEDPTCLNCLAPEDGDGHIFLALNPSIAFPILDRLLGGRPQPTKKVPRRSLTNIDLKLLARVTELAIQSLQSAWSPICELKLRSTRVETNCLRCDVLSAEEEVVRIAFDVAMDDVRGNIQLCLPITFLQTISTTTDVADADTDGTDDIRDTSNGQTDIAENRANVIVNLANLSLSTTEIRNLEVGDVMLTEAKPDQALQVLVNGRPMYNGHPGVLDGHKAVQISAVIGPAPNSVETERKLNMTEAAISMQ